MEKLLCALCDRYQEILGENFTGLYLHGSYATSGFNPLKSDLDYILLCEKEPKDPVKRALMDATLAFLPLAPAKGLEMHLVLKEDVLRPSYPPRFVLHASPAHIKHYLRDPNGYVARMKGRDIDLTAHFAVTYARGRAFRGPAVRSLFGPVPRQAYLRSIASDIEWQRDACLYHVLNACRTWAYLTEGSILSKTEGARWALAHLPEGSRPLIREALRCAQGDGELPATKEAEIFCQRIARRVFDALEQENNQQGGGPMLFSTCVPAVFGSQPIPNASSDSLLSKAPPTLAQALPIIRACGGEAFEFWSWWDQDMEAVLAAQRETGLACAALCTPFISLTDPARRADYLAGLEKTIEVAKRLHCARIISQVGSERVGVPRPEQHASIVAGLKACVPLLRGSGVTLVFEPLNTKVDHPGYYLWTAQEAFEIEEEVHDPQIKVLYDLYHQHVMNDLDLEAIRKNLHRIAHFHIAGHPGRHNPLHPNEVDAMALFRAIRDMGYQGYIGLEYMPLEDPAEGLKEILDAVKAL